MILTNKHDPEENDIYENVNTVHLPEDQQKGKNNSYLLKLYWPYCNQKGTLTTQYCPTPGFGLICHLPVNESASHNPMIHRKTSLV